MSGEIAGPPTAVPEVRAAERARGPGGEARGTTYGRMARSVELVLRWGLAALFAYAGVAKLRDPSAFATEIANYHLLPALAPVLAATLPAIEVLLALTLVLAPPPWRRAAAVSAAALLLVFSGAVAQVVVRGINVDCGCFGGNSGPVTGLTLARDLGLLAAAAVLAIGRERRTA